MLLIYTALRWDCSLCEAVRAANASPGTDTIVIPAGTYILTIIGEDDDANAGDLDITDSVVLNGNDAQNTVINGGEGWIDRIIDIIYCDNVEIRDLKITGGNAQPSNIDGGGIYNFESNTLLDRVIVENNRAGYGGGGIFVDGGSLTIANSKVTNNIAREGGGVQGYYNASITIIDSTISGNTANGPGGGIFGESGLLTLSGSAVTNNTGHFGGGIVIDSSELTITNSTISGNVAGADGGGIWSTNGANLLNVTITNNVAGADLVVGDGGGIHNYFGAFTIKNTLIAGNTDLDGTPTERRPDCSGYIVSLGHNLIGNGYGCTITGGSADQVGTRNRPIDPILGPLQDNGGDTFTHALLSGSPAIDAGDNNGCPTTDQRGYLRDTNCDIGAYEYNAQLPSGYVPERGEKNRLSYGKSSAKQFRLAAQPLAKPPTKTPTPR
jgi:hypothetical protein